MITISGRHRHVRLTPARRALLGTAPLVGTAGVATGLLTGMTPADQDVTDPMLPGAAATAAGATASRTLPGMGGTAMDAVAGARDASAARQAAGEASAERVSTVAGELRRQADRRADTARAAGDAELAGYHEREAGRQERMQTTSRPVVVSPRDTADDDPGASCTADDLLELGPLAVSGPDSGCGLDPWIADQLDHD